MILRTGNRARRGFTLLEMLVAVVLFAVMAVLAYGGLSRVLAGRDAVDQQAKRWRNLDALFTRLQDDLDATLLRSTRNVYGVSEPPLQGAATVVGEDDANLWLVRNEPDGIAPRRLGYRFLEKEQRLELLSWDHLDLAPRARPRVQTLLEGVKSATFTFMDQSGLWNPIWPSNNNNGAHPRAVKLELVLQDDITVNRVLLLP